MVSVRGGLVWFWFGFWLGVAWARGKWRVVLRRRRLVEDVDLYTGQAGRVQRSLVGWRIGEAQVENGR